MKSQLRLLLHTAMGVVLAACSTPAPSVKYYGDDHDPGSGYRFVIPRTVIKVSHNTDAKSTKADDTTNNPTGAGAHPNSQAHSGVPVGDKSTSTSGTLSVTAVPVRYDVGGKELPIFTVVDSTSSGGLVSTSITNVKFADQLIIQSIGTEVTDNRKEVIDAVIGAVGLAGKVFGFAGGGQSVKCKDNPSLDDFSDFVIDNVAKMDNPVMAPGNNCWAYQITEVKALTDPKNSFAIAGSTNTLPLDTKVSWFPYPACATIAVTVFPCDASSDAGTCKPRATHELVFVGELAVADGQHYRKSPLPGKGKLDLHADFCAVDATSAASSTSDWSLVSEAIKDVNNLKQKGTAASKK